MKIRKPLIFIGGLLLIFSIWACGDVLGDGAYRSGCSAGFANCTFQGNSIFLGPVSSSYACPSGFLRSQPNECFTTGANIQNITIATTCTTIDLNANWSVPSTVITADMPVSITVRSGTAVGNENVVVWFYSDAGCTNKILSGLANGMPTLSAYSPLTSAGTDIAQVVAERKIFLNSSSTFYAKKVDTLPAGANSFVTIGPVIYFNN